MPRWVGAATFHDIALDVDCEFVRAGDGAWRCLPLSSVLASTPSISASYFANDVCTRPLVHAFATCSRPVPTQAGFRTSTCPVLERRMALGAVISADAPVFTVASDGHCAPVSLGASARADLHVLDAEIDYAAYVAAERRDGTPQNGYAEAALVASDGAVQPLGFVASSASELLLPWPAADGAPRLLPVDTGDLSTGSAYANDTCTTPAAAIAGSCTTAPAHAVAAELSADAGLTLHRVHALGAKLETTFGYPGLSGSCGPITLPGQTAFALGPELAPSTFPATPALSTSAVGRLTRRAKGVASTWRWGGDVVRDTQLGVEVVPARASDGAQRWLPAGYGLDIALARYFSDFKCTTPLTVISGPCPEMLRYGWLVQDCRVGREVRPLTPYTGPVQQKSGGICLPATQVYGTPYAFGDPISPETFLPATIVLR